MDYENFKLDDKEIAYIGNKEDIEFLVKNEAKLRKFITAIIVVTTNNKGFQLSTMLAKIDVMKILNPEIDKVFNSLKEYLEVKRNEN